MLIDDALVNNRQLRAWTNVEVLFIEIGAIHHLGKAALKQIGSVDLDR